MRDDTLALQLFDIGAVKFGTFTLKSGMESPVYFDLRVMVSYPKILKAVAEAIWDEVKDRQFDLICGVPYTALPIATYISITHNIPMVMRRKEAKAYGTKKVIEGVYKVGQRCLVIEDLITSGASVLETVEALEKDGLVVKDVVAFLNREQGGEQRLKDKGYDTHFVYPITEVLNILEENEKISPFEKQNTLDFINTAQVTS